MSISSTELYIALGIAALLGGSLAFLFWRQRKAAQEPAHLKPKPESVPSAGGLQLHAYERLILLTERIALPNLINRVNQPGLNLREMQVLLTQHIRQEFEYNITQQIYVSPEAWEAVKHMKDQNLLIINQVAAFLPEQATGMDLNKAILEMLVQNPKASLESVVSEVLNYEAKKLLK